MKALHQFVDNNVHPLFKEGSKLEKYWPVYDGFYTFLFTPGHPADGKAHIRDGVDLKRTMNTVITALIPTLLFGMWNVGYHHFNAIGIDAIFFEQFLFGAIKVIPMVMVSYGVGLGIEFLFCVIKGHQIEEGYLVSGMLIPLIMPVDLPLWMLALSVAFAVIIGKEVFGGTGMNIFNPALLARAFAFFAYPTYMSGDKVWINTTGTEGMMAVDGFSGATALGDYATTGVSQYSALDAFIGIIPGSVGETSVIAIMLGAGLLLFTGIASWRIMLSAVVGGVVMGLIFNAVAPFALSAEQEAFMAVPFWQQLVMGGFAFGVVYMATDPVSGSQTDTGKYVYGFLIGFLSIMIRVFNPAYPEGVMLAILFMNTMAPLVDHYVIQANIKKREQRLALKTATA